MRSATLTLGAAIGAVMAVPLVRTLFYPVGRALVTSAEGPVDVLDGASLPRGGPPVQARIVAGEQRDGWGVRDQVAIGSVWLSRAASGEVQAYSAVCPHLGCAIGYDPAADQFRCPCHRSAFSRDGARLAGPSKRGLDPLVAEEKDGRVRVTFVRYRPDVAERIKA